MIPRWVVVLVLMTVSCVFYGACWVVVGHVHPLVFSLAP